MKPLTVCLNQKAPKYYLRTKYVPVLCFSWFIY